MIKVFWLSHKREKLSVSSIAWFMFQYIYPIYRYIKKKSKGMQICYLQACQYRKKTTKKTNNLNTHGIMMKTTNLFCKKWPYHLTSIISNQELIMYGTVRKLGLIPMEVVCTYKLFKGEKVEVTNWGVSTILVHVTYIYLRLRSMLHIAHHCTPSQWVIPRYPLQHPTGLDSQSHTIWIYGWIRLSWSHGPILKHMRRLPCQQSDTFLW